MIEQDGIVPNYPIGRLTVRAALRGPQYLLTRSVSEGLFPFCRKDLRQSSLTLRVSVERNRRCQGRDAVNPRPWDDPIETDLYSPSFCNVESTCKR